MREGNEVSITVQLLNTEFKQSIEIAILTTNGDGVTSDDYSGVPESVVFQPGQVLKSFLVKANKDELFEYDETVALSFGPLPSGLTGASPSSTTIVIQDLFGEPTISIGNGLAYENLGEMTFEVRPSLPSAEEVSVTWETVDGDALAGEDYEASSGTATFTPGVTGPIIVRVPIVNDSRSESNETFTVRLSDPKNGIAGPVATGAIIDDDSREVEVSPQQLAVQEGQSSSYSVKLTSQPTDPVTVTLLPNGEAQLAVSPQTLVFTDADWDMPQRVTVTAPDDSDAVVEPPVTIGNGVSGGDYEDVEAPSVTVTIAETDHARVSVGDAHAGEADGEIVFVIEMDMPTNRTVRVGWETSDGSAKGGNDYVRARGQATFPSMETRMEIAVPILDDEMDEPAETFALSLTTVTNALLGDATTATGMIMDDDLAAVSIRAVANQVMEGEPARFSLLRVGDLSVPLTVPVEVNQVGKVIAGAPPANATFAVGAATAILSVPTEDDQLDEADAVVEARIQDGDDHIVSGESSATVRVTDNDLPSVSIVAVVDRVTEGDDARFEATRLGDLSVPLNVAVEVGQSGDVLSGAPPASVSFAAGADTAVLAVETQDDQLDEDDGMVKATLAEGGGHVVAGAGDAMVTIADDDAAPTVAIANAQAPESAGEIVFIVSLGGPSGRMVTADWATSDGTATAGDDYGAGSGSLVIEPGRMSDTIRIEVMDDLLDEESETFAVALGTLVNTQPGTVAATGTIMDDDVPVAKAWLSRFGRTVATQVVDAVSDRVFHGGPGVGLMIGGGNHPDAGWGDIIPSSSFRFSSMKQVGPGQAAQGWTIWGRGASNRFSGEETEMSLDGGVVTGMVGADYQRGSMLAGLLLSHSQGGGDYRGTPLDLSGRPMQGIVNRPGDLGSSLTGVHPYIRVNITERIAAWGLFGHGRGRMTVSPGGHDTGIGMNLGAVGARGALLSPGASGGFGLALKSDAFFAGVSSDRSDGGLPAEDVGTSRLRLALEGSRSIVSGNGGRLGLSLEAGLRQDGGDAETGTGLEMGGRVRYANPQHGLSVEASARGLLAHEDENYEEWGVSGALVFDPDRTERGFSIRMRTAMGAVRGGVDRLWSQHTVDGLTRGRSALGDEPSVNAEVNYGVGTLGEQAVVTPFANILLAGGETPGYRLGWRVRVGPSFRLSLENTFGGDRRGSSGRGLRFRGSLRRE